MWHKADVFFTCWTAWLGVVEPEMAPPPVRADKNASHAAFLKSSSNIWPLALGESGDTDVVLGMKLLEGAVVLLWKKAPPLPDEYADDGVTGWREHGDPCVRPHRDSTHGGRERTRSSNAAR